MPLLDSSDLSGNAVESFEIRESDVPVAQTSVIQPTIRLTSCVDSLAKLHSVGDHRLCVISDERFELKRFTALVSTADVPDTEVTSPAESASSATAPTLSIILGVLYAVVGLAAVLAMAFIGKKMRERRRARLASTQLDEYFDARGLTPPPMQSTLSRLSGVTRNSDVGARPSRQLPRLHSQSPRGFLRPLLRVLSGRKHEASVPPLKPSATSSEDLSLVESALQAQGSASALESYRLPDGSVTLDALVSSCAGLQLHMATLRTTNSGDGDESESVRPVLASLLAPGLAAREPELVAAFMDEVKQSAAITHPTIVSFLGYCQLTADDESAMCALSAQPVNGDLEHFLTKRPQDWQWLSDSGGATNLRPKAAIALDVIDSLVHLHTRSPKRFVGNLRAKKVWLDSDFTAKVHCFGSDSRFGSALLTTLSATSFSGSASSPTALSRQHSPTSTSASLCPHETSVAWMAPEVLRGQQSASEQSDIYAFGVLLTELDTCELPYSLGIDDLDREQVATLVCSGCIRPALSIDCPAPIRALILKCLSFSPGDRPRGVEVQSALRKLVEPSHEATATPVGRQEEDQDAAPDDSSSSSKEVEEAGEGAASATAETAGQIV